MFLFKKLIFCMFKIATHWFPCDISIYISIIIQIGSSYFSPFYLSPLLLLISTGLKILYSFLYRKYINLHLLYFLLLSSLCPITNFP
jgi:hypothetical protein